MKRILILTATLTAIALPAPAQELQGCWMETSSGQIITLDDLCPLPPAPVAAVDNSEASATAAVVYAEAYCRSREDGLGDTSARESGQAAAATYLADQGARPSEDFLDLVNGAIATFCPGL